MTLAILAGPWVWSWITFPHARPQPLPGYIADSSTLRREYLRFTGRTLDPSVEEQFQRATDHMLIGDDSSAVILLENAVKQAAVPVVFNNLGVMYSKLKDGPRAVDAFRDALAHDRDYQPARANLNRMKAASAADPLSHEAEPNATFAQANIVWLGKPVDADIQQGMGDVDCYKVVSPPSPRDILAIQVTNRSITLVPRVRVYDSGGQFMDSETEAQAAGGAVRLDISPPPNTTLYIRVDGSTSTAGAYTLSVSALTAFDLYEPNDDILSARKFILGETIQANIMDARDNDYFSFVSPVNGSVSIDIVNRSATLIPALTTFTPDMRSSGFAPDVQKPGADLHHVMPVEANQVFYIQVWGQKETSGAYSLTIK